MKILFFKIIVFLILMAIVIRIPGCFDNTSSKDENVARLALADRDEFKNVDILVLGNSHSYCGINPEVFVERQIGMLNYATAAAGPYAIKLCFDDYVARSGTKPKSVLINLSPAMFCEASDVFDQYPIHRYLKEPLTNEEMLMKGYVSMKQYFKLTTKSCTQGMKKFFITETLGEKMTKSLFENAGYVPRKGLFTDSLDKANEKLYKATLEKQEFDQEKARFFLDFIDGLIKENISVILHEIPSNRYNDFFNKEMMDEYSSFYIKLDFRKDLMLYEAGMMQPTNWTEQKLFADMDHLNIRGAQIYSRVLADFLIDLKKYEKQ